MANGLVPAADFEAAIAHLALQSSFAPSSSCATQASRSAAAPSKSSAARPAASGSRASIDCLGPTLPTELLLLVASHLGTSSDHHAWRASTSSDAEAYRTLLSLSASSCALHKLLAPQVWPRVVLEHPLRLSTLLWVLSYYSRMPQGRLRNPAAHIRSLALRYPRHLPAVNQTALRALLSVCAPERFVQLEWEAEEEPEAPTLRLLLPPAVRSLADAAQKAARAAVTSEQSAAVRTWERSDRPGSYPINGSAQVLAADAALDEPTSCIERLSLSCGIFWPGHPYLSWFRAVRHLRLIDYDGHLLLPHLPPLLLALRAPLLSLSMSSSKTAVLHSDTLINAGCWKALEKLDIYAVTPEPPLDKALASCRHTLSDLRLVLDVSGAFTNYDALWTSLTTAWRFDRVGDAQDSGAPEAVFPALRNLQVDPFPQQHTAPSFTDFVRACPNLETINGQDAVTLRLKGLELVDPDHITGALAF